MRTHHRPSAARVLCSPSNDGLEWSYVGILRLHPDPTANLIAGFAGAGSGIAFALGTLAVTLWLRWRRLRKVAAQRKSHRVAGAAAHESVHGTSGHIGPLVAALDGAHRRRRRSSLRRGARRRSPAWTSPTSSSKSGSAEPRNAPDPVNRSVVLCVLADRSGCVGRGVPRCPQRDNRRREGRLLRAHAFPLLCGRGER